MSSSNLPALGMPDLLEGKSRQAPPLGDVLHLLQDVLLRRAPHVDVVAVARSVVARDGLAEVVGAVVAWGKKTEGQC